MSAPLIPQEIYLLERYSSLDYFGDMRDHFAAMVKASNDALAEFMHKPGWYDQLKALYQGKRDIFRQALSSSRFELLPCQGTYFQCVKYSAISDEGDRAFVERLTRDHGVAAIPVSAFYKGGDDFGVIRFCFAKSATTLQQALERLIKL